LGASLALSTTLLANLAGCSEGDDADPNSNPSTFGEESESGEQESGDESSSTDASTGESSGGDGDAGDGDGDGDGDGEVCDETPWSGVWIGDPCESDDDCSFEGGYCITDDEGFPCGTCSTSCDLYCDDLDGAATTFCVNTDDVSVMPAGGGTCLSQCDPSLFGGDGCRPGYDCVILPRHNEPATTKGTCIPEGLGSEPSDCLSDLEAMGLSFVPAQIPLEHPEGLPNLDCTLEDPVYLYPPINGVTWNYTTSSEENPVLVSCEMAKAIEKMTEILANMDAKSFQHIGTYNCRVISGTETLSEHAFARAIDLAGFTLNDDSVYTLIDDWEDGVDEPVTPGGQWLKEFADTRFAEGVFNIILTPNYNAAHDDHFHVDLTPGGNYYN
jgi:hypothetical protein